MKSLFALVLTLSATTAYAGETITCALSEQANPKNVASVQVELKPSMEGEYVYADQTLDIGKNNFSFELAIDRAGDQLTLSVLFSENNRTHDEIDNTSWEIDLGKVKSGAAVAQYALEYRGKKVATFTCNYGR